MVFVSAIFDIMIALFAIGKIEHLDDLLRRVIHSHPRNKNGLGIDEISSKNCNYSIKAKNMNLGCPWVLA